MQLVVPDVPPACVLWLGHRSGWSFLLFLTWLPPEWGGGCAPFSTPSKNQIIIPNYCPSMLVLILPISAGHIIFIHWACIDPAPSFQIQHMKPYHCLTVFAHTHTHPHPVCLHTSFLPSFLLTESWFQASIHAHPSSPRNWHCPSSGANLD